VLALGPQLFTAAVEWSASVQPAFWNNLAHIFAIKDDHRGACKIYAQIVQSAPEYCDVLNNMGVALLSKGDAANAAQCFQTILMRVGLRHSA
jgi:Tfp pilus assembly protein PilF